MDFITEVKDFLNAHHIKFVSGIDMPETDLPLLLVEDKKLLIHLVSPGKSTQNPALFFGMNHMSRTKHLKLVHIWQDVWQSKGAIVRSRLLALAGQAEKIHARSGIIGRIDKKAADHFLEENHLQGATSAYYKYGFFHEDMLVAVATFSKSRVMHDGPSYYRSYELERYASKTGVTVNGGLGKLLGHFINEHHVVHLMTYSDNDWGNGSGYEKLGFEMTGETEGQAFMLSPELVRYLPGETFPDGYIRVYNSGSRKWILDKRKGRAV